MDWPTSLITYMSESKIQRIIRECIEISEEYNRIMDNDEQVPLPDNVKPMVKKDKKTDAQLQLERQAQINKNRADKLAQERKRSNEKVLWNNRLDSKTRNSSNKDKK